MAFTIAFIILEHILHVYVVVFIDDLFEGYKKHKILYALLFGHSLQT